MIRYAFGLVGLLVLATPASSPDEFTAKVVGISDGDTLTVLRDREQVKIRLHGIDAPEMGQDFGSKAKQHASELAFGQQVTVRAFEKDRYGRTVAEIVLPQGTSLNRKMVEDGFAWWYKQYAPRDSELKDAEKAARDATRGLWAAKNRIAPWEWRGGRALTPDEARQVVGNRNTKLYHKATCNNATKIAERNRTTFDTPEKAIEAGFRAARDCHKWR